ncbi:MAG: CapA family protein [Lachnospiraceae bacterium]|nr:CapA family protein [Lachnospiraceae bacterium]
MKILMIAAMIFAAIVIVCFALKILYEAGRLLPYWVAWNEKIEVFGEDYEFVLKDKCFFINTKDGSVNLFSSDEGYRISDFLVFDVDGDSDKELLLLLWKKGKYENARPFWLTDKDDEWCQHIFIYDIGLKETKDQNMKENMEEPLHQKWFTSDLGRNIKRWRVLDQNENIKLKKDPKINTLLVEDTDENVTLWAWQSWGLKNYESYVRFVAFGDLIIHEDILNYGLYKRGGNFGFLFEDIKSELNEADISSLNLESILVNDERAYSGYPKFGAPVSLGDSIADAGFDIVTCANNHSLDKGPYGLKTTYDLFAGKKDIDCLGINDSEAAKCPYLIVVKNGIRFAFYNYTYGTNLPDEYERYSVNDLSLIDREKLKNDLSEGRKEADVVIAFVHWGDEYQKEISSEQKEYAGLFNECGVDVVVGSHPHVVQPVETIKGKDGFETLVYYSLGNFRASQNDVNTREGAEAVFTFSYTYDGIKMTDHELLRFDSYWQG